VERVEGEKELSKIAVTHAPNGLKRYVLEIGLIDDPVEIVIRRELLEIVKV
jgi:hypothetical protein